MGYYRSLASRNPSLILEHLRYVLQTDPLRSWFHYALIHQLQNAREGRGVAASYYEFGVGRGDSLVRFLKALRTHRRIFGQRAEGYRVFVFDSFKGLPTTADPRDLHPLWEPGDFAHSEQAVRNYIAYEGLARELSRVRFVTGEFSKSLTEGLRDELCHTPPSIVNIDVDYASSTQTVLEWLQPFLEDGTLFHFDDIWSFAGRPQSGQLAAISTFNARGGGTLVPFPKMCPTLLGGETYIYATPGE